MLRRIGVLALCRDEQGRVLLVPAGPGSAVGNGSAANGFAGDGFAADGGTGRSGWSLPGGLIRHGEHPEASMRRHLPMDGSAIVAVGRPVTVVTDIDHAVHDDWIVLDVTLGGTAHVAHGGQAPLPRWVSLAEVDALPLAEVTARALGRESSSPSAVGTALPGSGRAGSGPAGSGPAGSGPALAEPVPSSAAATWRRQRFAVYALATDPSGRVLLTRISDGYPGAGHWHLPGGGTDAGESATAGLLRELIEETDQRGRLGEPLSLSHRHQRDAMGPEGVPIDWQGIRVVYRVHIDVPTPARVTEGAGSTVDAGWFTASEVLGLSLTEVARDSIARHLR